MIPAPVRDKLEKCTSLPTLPAIALQVLTLCQSEDFSLSEIARTISSDPALAARILKMANSPIMGLRTTAKTINHAVALLGMTTVRTAALSFSLINYMRKDPGTSIEHTVYWKRSIMSAIAAQELAIATGTPHPDEGFLASLLQDIGILALAQALGALYGELYRTAAGDHRKLVSLERGTLDCNHAEVGAWLLRRWQLPSFLVQSVEASHSGALVELESDLDASTLTRVVSLSGWVADIWVRSDAGAATEVAGERARALLGFGTEQLSPVLASVATAIVGDVGRLFDLSIADTGSPDEIASILEQARESLVMLTWEAEKKAEEATQIVSELENKAQALKEQTQRDRLTKIYNRERLQSVLTQEFRRAWLSAKPLSILFCDLDHFKQVNDDCGHVVGDEVLVTVASALGFGLRPQDLLARYGGEEFVIVLPETDSKGARAIAERLRTGVAKSSVRALDGRPLSVTVSIGTATLVSRSFESPNDMLDAADQAMYAAKSTGRDRVVSWEELGDRGPTSRRSAPRP